MKRLHVHLSVDNLSESIHFYSTLFAPNRPSANPTTPSGCWTIRG